MSFATVERDIETRLSNNWITTPIDINENIDFNIPANTDFIKLRIKDETVSRPNIGTPAINRVQGKIRIEVYTSKDTGTRIVKDYIDDLFALFDDAQFNGITCDVGFIDDVGDHEGRYRIDVYIPFWWDGRY